MAACAPAGKHSLTHNYGACKAHVSLQYVRTILTLKLTERWRVKKSVIPGRRLTGQNGTLKAPLPLPLSYPFSLSFSMIWCMAPINVPLLSLNRKTMQKWKHLLKGMREWCMTSLYTKTAVPPMISRGFQKSRGPLSKTPFTCVDETWKSETPLMIRTQMGRVIAGPN